MKKTIFVVFLLALAVGAFAQQKSERLTTNALQVTLIDNGSKLRFDNNQNSGTVQVVLVIYWANGSSSVQLFNVSKPPSTVLTYVGNSQWEWMPNPDLHTTVSLNERATAIGLPTESQRRAAETQAEAKRFFSSGTAYYGKGDYDRAIADLTQAIRLDPNYALAYGVRADAYYGKGDYDRAIADYTQAMRLDPNDVIAYFSRGIVYKEKGDYDRAIADFTQAIRLSPNYANAYFNRGIVYKEKGDYDRAIADYTQAIQLVPNHAALYSNRADAHKQKGNFTQARVDVNRALQIDPNYEEAKTLSADLRKQGY